MIKRKISIVFSTVVLAVVMLCGFSFEAFAASKDTDKDYTMTGCSWEEDADGDIRAIWDETADKSSYKVRLIKGTKEIGKWISTSNESYSFTVAIAEEGKGTYYFKVYATKGGTDTTITSESFVVDSENYSTIKSKAKTLKKTIGSSSSTTSTVKAGWKPNPNGTWMYAPDTTGYVKNKWYQVDGEWYYFDSKGYMLTGWQGIGKWWYYLDADGKHGKPLGALWTDTNTPDGYAVNKDGVYCVSGVGVPYEKKTASTSKTSSKSSSSSSSSSSTKKETIKLSAPTNLYITSENILKWDKVENAKRYKVRYYVDGSLEDTFTGTTAQIDLDDKGIEVSSDVKLSISALGPDSNNSKYRESNYTTITDLALFAEKYFIPGELKTSGTSLIYKDEDGERYSGWIELAGYWYHFNDKGRAEAPGWYKDEDGYWFYFDEKHRMMTGKIKDGDKEYYLNDGSNTNYPLGAWIE